MIVTIYDLETTGLPLWKEPSEHPGQPHICQFTAVRFDDETGDELEYFNAIVKPDGWVIPAEVTAIHGITMERAMDEGIPEKTVVKRYLDLLDRTERLSAYNISFDQRIMRIAMLRNGLTKTEIDDIQSAVWAHCCMQQATPLVKAPPTAKMMATGRKTFKNPSLAEAVKAILGEDMEGAHDSRVDVAYTVRLYLAMNQKVRTDVA